MEKYIFSDSVLINELKAHNAHSQISKNKSHQYAFSFICGV